MTSTHTLTLTPPLGTRTIRVLHVRTVAGNGGGPEKTIFRSASYLHALGVAAEALYLLDANTSSDSLLTRASAAEMPVHVVREKSALDPSGPAAFARLIRRGRFDIVHTHDYKSNTIARMLAPAASYRIVATAHGYNQTTAREAYYYWLEKMLLRRADAVICPSSDLADLLADAGVSRRRLCVLHNGVELDRWPFRPRWRDVAAGRILYCGRLSKEKNIATMLEACAMLRERSRELHLRIAGDGPQLDELRDCAVEFGLATCTEFLGRREDIPELLSWADVAVNPSSTEAMPNSVLEALASGTPVVATDVGATGELVVHERTGLLVPPGNAGAIADALARLLDDPQLAFSLAHAGRAHVEQRFNFANRMAHVVAIYRGVLAAAGRSV